jgi:hypothetical protein
MADDQHDREVRAARNQALFRSINEKLRELNEAMNAASRTFVIACECADTSCLATFDIPAERYESVRAHPAHFAVCPGHVYPEVEDVVEASDGDPYVVVEKRGAAATYAERLDPRAEQSA